MEEKKSKKILKTVLFVILIAFISSLLTVNVINQYFALTADERDLIYKFSKYKSVIDKYYLGDVDEEKLEESAIKGYFEGLEDPYTEYIPKTELQEYMEETTGSFVGIGIYMVQKTDENKIMVLSPIKGSPAEEAGILAGDIIMKVDGVEYSGEEMSEASSKIKGEEGSKVVLEILRGTETKTFEIERRSVKVNPVESKMLEGEIGYIIFSSFDDGTAEEFKNKYYELEAQGMKGLIIDLRNNGGGIVSEALKIADYILDKDQVILYEVDKYDKEEVTKSENDPFVKVPVVVLTNKNTASSSEILAGALKDNKKATIVGTTTYGKGIIQRILNFKDGSGLKITVEEYLTPNKTKIHTVGIIPDEAVELPSTVKSLSNVEEKDDTQLQKAIEILK